MHTCVCTSMYTHLHLLLYIYRHTASACMCVNICVYIYIRIYMTDTCICHMSNAWCWASSLPTSAPCRLQSPMAPYGQTHNQAWRIHKMTGKKTLEHVWASYKTCETCLKRQEVRVLRSTVKCLFLEEGCWCRPEGAAGKSSEILRARHDKQKESTGSP